MQLTNLKAVIFFTKMSELFYLSDIKVFNRMIGFRICENLFCKMNYLFFKKSHPDIRKTKKMYIYIYFKNVQIHA